MLLLKEIMKLYSGILLIIILDEILKTELKLGGYWAYFKQLLQGEIVKNPLFKAGA